MRRDVTAALRLTLQGHLTLRKSRLESFCVLVVGVLLSRTVNLSHLACMFPTRAEITSNYRRLQRFFEQVILDGSQLARVIVRIVGLGSGPWLLALDRTCWKFGRYDINVLMLAIIHNGIAIPVMWDVLGRAGTSTTAQRSALVPLPRRLWRDRHRWIDRRSGVHRQGLDQPLSCHGSVWWRVGWACDSRTRCERSALDERD